MFRPSLLQELLDLEFPPVALSFREAPPEGVARLPQPAAAGCGYWRLAAEGAAFFTTPEDHFGCPVGAYTHGVSLPPAQAAELEALVGTMVGLEYLDPREVERLPRREAPFGAAVYAPLGALSGRPDVVLVRGNARQMMLLTEAARHAGCPPESPPLGRPACALVAETLRTGRPALSLGCIGNRVYTELGDEELYLAIPGERLEAIERALDTILRANRELEAFHRARAAAC